MINLCKVFQYLRYLRTLIKQLFFFDVHSLMVFDFIFEKLKQQKLVLEKLKLNASSMNTCWLMLEKVGFVACNFLVSVALARYLEPSEFGLFSLLLAMMAMAMPFISLGFHSIISRELLISKHTEGTLLLTAFLFRFIAAVILFLVVLVTYYLKIDLFNLQSEFWILVLLMAVNIFSAFEIYNYYFQALLIVKVVALARLVLLVLFTALKLLLVYLGSSFDLLIWIFAIETALQYLAYYFLYRFFSCSHSNPVGKFDLSYGKLLLKESSWLIMSGIAAVIYLKIDIVMLGSLASIEDVAVYSVAAKISEIWYFIPIAISTSFFPQLIALKKYNAHLYNERLQSLCNMLLLLALVICISVFFLSPLIIPIIFGVQYIEAVIILQIHIWACVFMFMRALFSKWILAEKMSYLSLVSQGIGAVLNIILNILFIPLWQGVGAALATFISYTVASYLILFCFKDSRKMAFIMTRSLLLPFFMLVSWVKLLK